MRLFCCVSQKLWMMAAARFTNSVESLSACSLRTATVLRSKISKVANASASTAVDAHLARSRLPKVPLLTQTLNCTTRAWCHGSGLVGVCCRRCVTFSALRHIRRCMHTTVGKLNAVLIWTISTVRAFLTRQGGSGGSSCVLTIMSLVLLIFCCLLQPRDMVNTNDRIPNHQTKCKFII